MGGGMGVGGGMVKKSGGSERVKMHLACEMRKDNF